MIKFMDNIGDYFATNYFDEDFLKKVFEKSGYGAEDIKEINKRISPLKDKYYKYKNDFINLKRAKDRIKRTHQFHTEVLNGLGYNGEATDYSELFLLNDKEGIPVRSKLYRGNNPHLFIMEMQAVISGADESVPGLFEQVYRREQWEYVFQITDTEIRLSPSVINEALSELLLIEQSRRPVYVLLLAGSEIYLIHYEKWFRGSYLRFSLEDLFDEATLKRDYYALFYFLLSKEALAPDSDIVLMDQLDEDSHKSAYAVTQDLKAGVIKAIENLANEAVYYLTQNNRLQTLDEHFANGLKDDCLTIVYRLLFLFYAESRPELEILPVNDEVYEKGYSLEMLRDLEQVPLQSESAKNSYFFHDSLWHLFELVGHGYNEGRVSTQSFVVKHIDSPLFDDRRLNGLQGVKFRNFVWQDIVRQLSLSQKQRGKARGRISYANLGINQLGSVYEGLLSYKGFFAEEDYIEVKKASDATGKEGTYVVPRSRRGDFEEDEILKDDDNPERDKIIPKGSFIYRLSGRDRQKSASYYTPEVLTHTTVKYTLKPILERLEKGEIKADELLKLKILEPAMGAAAFHNEVINQLAEAYLDWKQREKKTKVKPNLYKEELQRVKAFIATNNVYGVDINPTAVELGKLSLWLNVIHKDMETPFFGYRLGVGNAVVGAWRKVYSKGDVILKWLNQRKTRYEKREWWNKAPRQIPWKEKGSRRKSDEIYHFLLPDKNMLASANIKLLKEEYPQKAKAVQKWKKDFTRPISGDEFKILQAISDKIDALFEEHYQQQQQLNATTQSNIKLWGQGEEQRELFDYREKERLAATRNQTNAPYYKLKMIMDYWCSLWFWDVRDAEELPTREEFINDILNILEVDIEKALQKESSQDDKNEDIFAPKVEQMGLGFARPAQPRLKAYKSADEKSKVSDAIAAHARPSSLLPHRRLKLIEKYSQQYRFFHYELEFVEVFKERGGFDVIVGNPPWVLVEFDEGGMVAEKYPEVILKNYSASQIRTLSQKLLRESKLNIRDYLNELMNANILQNFITSVQVYDLLINQKNNIYKSILLCSHLLVNLLGFIGMIHPVTIFDDPKAKKFRKKLYGTLKYHFRFINELMLFREIDHHNHFSINVYSGKNDKISFRMIANIFHPVTIDSSFVHCGSGVCRGIKKKAGDLLQWNIEPHKSRIVDFDYEKLKILSEVFEGNSNGDEAKLIPLHMSEAINILICIKNQKRKIKDSEYKLIIGFDENKEVRDGTLMKSTKYVDINKYELIYNGPHFFVSNPLYKCPRKKCNFNLDYDIINLQNMEINYTPRTNFIRNIEVAKYKAKMKGFQIELDNEGNIIYDSAMDYFRVAMSRMLSINGERTLQTALLAPKIAHMNSINALLFKNELDTLKSIAITSSIIMDFYVKLIGASNLTQNIIENFPLNIKSEYLNDIICRVLILNCVTEFYSRIWYSSYSTDFKKCLWSRNDIRLKDFSELEKIWSKDIPIKNYFERRLALIEIDVLIAISFGIDLQDLIMIYNIQFPVLQQYEMDTWFDKKGNIVFTSNKGLNGVGLDRREWEQVKNNKEGELVKHTITKSELYYGKEVTYYPPFDKCDRIEDYKRAWAHFEKIFAEK